MRCVANSGVICAAGPPVVPAPRPPTFAAASSSLPFCASFRFRFFVFFALPLPPPPRLHLLIGAAPRGLVAAALGRLARLPLRRALDTHALPACPARLCAARVGAAAAAAASCTASCSAASSTHSFASAAACAASAAFASACASFFTLAPAAFFTLAAAAAAVGHLRRPPPATAPFVPAPTRLKRTTTPALVRFNDVPPPAFGFAFGQLLAAPPLSSAVIRFMR
jgi:hypothetical protein